MWISFRQCSKHNDTKNAFIMIMIGLNQMRTMYAFSICIIEIVMRKGQK